MTSFPVSGHGLNRFLAGSAGFQAALGYQLPLLDVDDLRAGDGLHERIQSWIVYDRLMGRGFRVGGLRLACRAAAGW